MVPTKHKLLTDNHRLFKSDVPRQASAKDVYKLRLLSYAIKRKRELYATKTIKIRQNHGIIFETNAEYYTHLSNKNNLFSTYFLRATRSLRNKYFAAWRKLIKLKSCFSFTTIRSSLNFAPLSFTKVLLSSINTFLNKFKPKKNFLNRFQFDPPRINLPRKIFKLKFKKNKHALDLQKLMRAKLTGKKRSSVRSKKKSLIGKGLAYLGGPFYQTIVFFPLQSLIALMMFGGIFFGTYWLHDIMFVDLPEPQELTNTQPPITTKILSRDGEVLYRFYEEENRTLVPLEKISPHLINATIAIEDQDFYSHHGFSIRGIIRAAIANYKDQTVQGGSTLTQQLVKNRLLTSEKTIERKLREILLAVLVETNYSKQEILEMYLNQVAYGGSTYGVEEAAYRYFNKPAAELSLAESALLAGLPAAPSVYSPFGSNPELAKDRQIEVLRRMVEDGYITQSRADEARRASLKFANNVIDIQAPHFVMYVKQILADKYGEELLLRGGLEITTTLDLNLQQQTQQIVTDEIDRLRNLRISNGAALITNPKTGEVLAMVGSRDYFDFDNDGQVNVTIRQRQPGSSIKPITYATALEKGATVSTIIQDQPITYSIAGSPPYSPQNYDGKFHGNVTLKEALASSYNVPAVKTLNQIGINQMIDQAQKMGITTWQDRSRFGLSLTLGGGEVKMIDMVKVYGTFANAGYTTEINPILEIKNYKGEILYHNSCVLDGIGCFRTKTIDSKTAYLISDILSDNKARTPAFGPQSTLYIPGQQVAVKTGTTNNLRDNWTIGYTSDRVVAVWVGNNDNTSMSYVASGVTGASPIWNQIMRSLLDENTPHQFAIPKGIVNVATCITTGTLPCSGCPKISEEPYVMGTQPYKACHLAHPSDPSKSGQPTAIQMENQDLVLNRRN